MASFQAQYGPESDNVGKVLGDLGGVYVSQGKLDKAVECLNRAFAIRAKYHPIESPEVLGTVEYAIGIIAEMGQLAKAAKLSEGLIKELESRVGPNDSRLRASLFVVASSMTQEGKYRAAEEIIQRVNAHRVRCGRWYSLDSDPAVEAMTIGSMYGEMGRYTEALEQFVRAEKVYIVRAKSGSQTQGND